MLIWKGLGILVPVFALAGFIAGSVLTKLVTDDMATTIVGSYAAAAVALWVFALTFGKGGIVQELDKRTGQWVIRNKSHSFFFFPPKFWALLTTLITAFSLAGVMSFEANGGGADVYARLEDASPAGKQAFEAANKKIYGNSEGVAHGNTEQAQALALLFSKTAKALRNNAIEGRATGLSITGGEMVTYAHVTPTRCVFLVHVPQLRKFSSEAKEVMGKIAWVAARQAAASLQPPPDTLAVGIRGTFIYDRAISGSVVALGAGDGIREQVKGAASDRLLSRLFEPEQSTAIVKNTGPEAAPQAATAPPADSQPAPATTQAMAAGGAQPAAAVPATLPTPMRDWRDASGRPLRASLVRFLDESGATGEFRREDDQVFQVPVERFSAEDQTYIQSFQAKKVSDSPSATGGK